MSARLESTENSSRLRANWASGRAFAHIAQFHPELTAFRRDLHAHPELGFEEHYTSGRVIHALKVCGVDSIQTGIGKTGVVATIEGRLKANHDTAAIQPMVGLRADMDALPMVEKNTFGWASSTPGRMHACGHDGHTAMLVGAARYLAETRAFAGTAVLVFQPAEEGLGGAAAMIADGLFERFPVQSIYAMHNWPALPPGSIGINPGPMMAAADRITIEITGRGGHGAHAYMAVDPVLVAAHTITALQSIVSRNVKAMDAAVISICAVEAGTMQAASVIPGSATLRGTVRSFSPDVQSLLERRIRELCHAVAAAFGATATVVYERGFPPTINTFAEYDLAATAAESLVGKANVNRNLEPSRGSEDFSFMLQIKPGAYLRIGQGEVDNLEAGSDLLPALPAGSRFLHNTRYDFNDQILPLGSALFAGIIERALPGTARLS